MTDKISIMQYKKYTGPLRPVIKSCAICRVENPLIYGVFIE